MKHLLKSSTFIVLTAMLLSLAGCANTSRSSTSSSAKTNSSSASTSSTAKAAATKTSAGFSLPYTTVPSFNPLLPASQSNMALWPLMYDCLAEPDTSYNPVKQLASSVTCSGTTVTVQLKSGVLFTDGTSLTASDVEYSYNLVKKHTESPYYARLSNIKTVAANGLTVTITLGAADPLFANMLDVPIIKSGSDAGNAIGTGRYTYIKNGVNATLKLNKSWHKGSTSSFSTIPLVNIPASGAIMSCLAIGEVNYVYSDNGSGAATSATNTKTSSVNLNQLVFIGINSQKANLNNAHFRRALSLSLNRKLLVSQTFSDRASACVAPFNPSWSQLPKPTDTQLSADFTAEATEMAAAGGASIKNATFTLLVNQENSVRTAAARYAASCFAKAGVTVTVKAVSFSDYNTLIKSGNFDMYIGETKLSNDMDISPFLASGGAAAYAAVSNSSSLAAFNAWRSGSKDIKSVASAFAAEMPFIPLCYRMGSTSYTSGLSGVTATDGDIFYNFEKWSY